MRSFDYMDTAAAALTPDVVMQLAEIQRLRGRIEVGGAMVPSALDSLAAVANIQSIDASNRIEGIVTTRSRLTALAGERTEPRGRNEAEIAGYRDVLATVHENFAHLSPTPNHILQMHRDMYRYTGSALAGTFKATDNVVAERDGSGVMTVRFQPLAAVGAPGAIGDICDQYRMAVAADRFDPLLLMCLFVFDFTCIHPFTDGNGRVSRLLTLLLMYRAGHSVGRYISIEREIERTRETYYEALQASSIGWLDGESDYIPWVRYMLGIVLAAYRQLAASVETASASGELKSARIERTIAESVGPLSKRDILERHPDISEITVERTLADLLRRGLVSKVGAGPATAYVSGNNEAE